MIMSDLVHFDTLILGSGQGGKRLAWHLAKAGERVASVERRWIGGSCPNVACLPSKNQMWSARVAHLVQHAAEFGTATGPVSTDVAAVRGRKRGMVNREVDAHLHNYDASGAELIMGSGRFVGLRTLEVALNDGGARTLTADKVFLNLGSHAAIPDVPGLAEAKPLTHIEALELDYSPRHLIVLGGGYVGLEMAQIHRRFGGRVTIIANGPQLMSHEDADVAQEIHRTLAGEGIEFLFSAEVMKVEGQSGREVALMVRSEKGETTIAGSDILVATGRVPNTRGIGLEEAGVALDERGFIRVNDRLETTAPAVWAMGESAGSPHFTHVSVDDFRIIRDNLAGGRRSTSDRLVPYCMFTDPPLAHVGLSEREAERQGIAVRVATLPTSRVLRTEATDEKQGFMKALVAAHDDRILGFTMIGSEAGEVMAVVQTAMIAGLPYPKLRDAVIAHLTMAEGLGPLFGNVSAAA
jgi:pyruvate/2-oxoglutarate dehydrogenase complex dihydrolipoamide dehydrogenase (E3) component